MYDALHRITQASGMSGGPWNYVYDGNGVRVEKSNASGGTLYWRSIFGDAIAETDLTGSTSNSNYHEYVFFAGRRIARREASGTIYYYYADALGSTRSITSSAGVVCGVYPESSEGPALSGVEGTRILIRTASRST